MWFFVCVLVLEAGLSFFHRDDTTLMAETEEELKSLLMKKESEKGSLKLNIQKEKIMASSLIASWQINGEKVETVSGFIFLGSKIAAVSDCSHKIKRHLTPWKKNYDKSRQCIKKQKHHFPDK
uniref:Uncharacterized protein n=3 Tax=Ovis aries TaxID=9940 RepID=A0AC11EID8_SHEEP